MKALALCFGFFVSAVQAMCFDEAAQRYNVNAHLLRAMAKVESSMNPDAMNMSHKARTGSYDIGLMQINSRWLPTLKKFDIDEAALRQPCTSVIVGAWILADTMQRNGASWNGVGAYNAACTQLKGTDCERARMKYANLVWRAMNKNATQKSSKDEQIIVKEAVPVNRQLIASVPMLLDGEKQFEQQKLED